MIAYILCPKVGFYASTFQDSLLSSHCLHIHHQCGHHHDSIKVLIFNHLCNVLDSYSRGTTDSSLSDSIAKFWNSSSFFSIHLSGNNTYNFMHHFTLNTYNLPTSISQQPIRIYIHCSYVNRLLLLLRTVFQELYPNLQALYRGPRFSNKRLKLCIVVFPS